MSTDISLEIFELTFELPAIPCDDPNHDTLPNHGGPATHYIKLLHNCVLPQGSVVTACEPVTQFLRKNMDDTAHCAVCRYTGVWADFVKILGPIGAMP